MKLNLYMTILNDSDSIGNVVKSLQDLSKKNHLINSIYCYKNNRKDLENVHQGLSFLFKIFSKNDEIHWFQYPHYYHSLELLKILKGIKVVEYQGVTPCNLWKYDEGKKLLAQAEAKRKIISYADIVITHSKFTYNELKKDLQKNVANLIMPINTDTKKFKMKKINFSKYKKKYGLNEEDIVLLTVGRFSYNKRIPVQINALKEILKHRKNVKLLIVGNNKNEPYASEYRYCLNLANKLKVLDNIRFITLASEKELVDLYNLADIYISSSLHEGFCMPIMEAMACGTPVIGSNAAAIPETIGKAGLIFKPNNSKDLSKKILKLLKDKKLYNSLVKKGLKRAKNNNINHHKFKKLISKIVGLRNCQQHIYV